MLRFLSRHPRTLAGRVFAIDVVIILVLVLGAGVAAFSFAAQSTRVAAQDKVLAIARSVAATPTVRDALGRANPSVTLQPFAERVRQETATDFVVVMDVRGTRFSHPNPDLIGGRYLGTIAPAVGGKVVIETYTGTLGPSVRAVVPVDDGGRVRGLVAVGIKVTAIDHRLDRELPALLTAAVVAFLLACAGYWLVNRWLRRATRGLEPADLRKMYEFYDAVLHAVREGLLLLDRAGRLQLANDEARRLLAIPDGALGRPIDTVGLPAPLGEALAAGGVRTDELYLAGGRVLVVSQAVGRWEDEVLGTVVTLRDHTELRALTSELDTVRGLADSLHAQAHEAANQLHTVTSLIELGRADQALEYATAELAAAQRLTDRILGAVAEPVLAALLIGKTAEAGERGVELVVAAQTRVPPGTADPRDLVTIFGNLIDNAVDAAQSAPAPRWVEVGARVESTSDDGGEVVFRVADSGGGVAPDDVVRAFRRGWSTKPVGRLPGRGLGLALVAQAVHRHGGHIEVTREEGAVFTVRLPLRREGRCAGSERATPVPAAAVIDTVVATTVGADSS